MKVSDLLKVEVQDLALGGPAIARHEGRVVFVDRGLPGDRIEARITRVKRNWAEARLVTIEAPSPLRIPALCPHVEHCGGCRFQDLPYDEQLRVKERQVREVLAHVGGIADPPVRSIVAAPRSFGYRNKMEFTFAPDPDGRPVLGLHERGAFDRVFALETCLLCSPLALGIVRFTAEFARAHGWQAYHPARHTGNVRFLVTRHLEETGECAAHLVAADEAIPALEEWARGVTALDPAVRTVTLSLNRSRGNVAFGEEERALIGDGTIRERIHGLEFEASANVFLQTNSTQAAALYQAALDATEIGPTDTVLDLYCGTGTLTLMLARAAARAVGVETVADSIARARRNAARNHIANARFVEGEARQVLREWARGERPEAPRPQVVVVDPPRAGLHPRVVARVAELSPKRIVYVSCNPATLARDLKDFGAHGWALADARPFDMFPHTPHIECVARLERRRSGA